jgi:hypothetical protein
MRNLSQRRTMNAPNTSQVYWGFLAGAGAAAFGFIIYRWHISRGRSALQRWALDKRFEILRSKRCFFCGPFPWWTTSQKQTVFFVTVRDGSGRERSGWLRFGDWLGGGYKDEPDIIWRESNAG